MPVRTVSDAIYTFIAWFPFIAAAFAAALLLLMGLMQLEIRSEGTEYFLPNGASPNYWNPQVADSWREAYNTNPTAAQPYYDPQTTDTLR
jgi:hypothetical protein